MVVNVTKATKIIKSRVIFEDVSITCNQAECIGIVGRNGCGKSMLLKAIAGFIKLTSGSVTVFDKEVGSNNCFIQDAGVLIERPGFLPNYSGFKNLCLLASIQNKVHPDYIIETMQRFGLVSHDKKKYHTYSLGQRQKLGLVQAIMENPKLLILDEPTNNLDESSVKLVWEELINLKAKGISIIIASHDVDEIRTLADRVYKMDNGRVYQSEGNQL